MAKSKKVKEVIEEAKVELPVEPIIEKTIEEKQEPVNLVDEPPLVTLDEVEAVKEIPATENKSGLWINMDALENVEPPISKDEVLKKFYDTGIVLGTEELSNEQKVLDFIESRDAGQIKLNDFLKSLYGVPKFNEPAKWLSQGASKELKLVLDKLSNEGQISIVSNAHMKLGTFYYPDTSTMKTEYHNLNTISIIAIKRN